jgi:hypothetical protein
LPTLNVTFTADGSKASSAITALGGRGGRQARAAEEDPDRRAGQPSASIRSFLGEIKGINIAAPSIDGRYCMPPTATSMQSV